mmetsp:Transcript_138010/g.440834  ORF Transcript_138010/g.440834 Transcript_138010/m.440834 type:complete len:314 (+) Transcript_138010:1120-2061(+)
MSTIAAMLLCAMPSSRYFCMARPTTTWTYRRCTMSCVRSRWAHTACLSCTSMRRGQRKWSWSRVSVTSCDLHFSSRAWVWVEQSLPEPPPRARLAGASFRPRCRRIVARSSSSAGRGCVQSRMPSGMRCGSSWSPRVRLVTQIIQMFPPRAEPLQAGSMSRTRGTAAAGPPSTEFGPSPSSGPGIGSSASRPCCPSGMWTRDCRSFYACRGRGRPAMVPCRTSSMHPIGASIRAGGARTVPWRTSRRCRWSSRHCRCRRVSSPQWPARTGSCRRGPRRGSRRSPRSNTVKSLRRQASLIVEPQKKMPCSTAVQ